MSADPEYYAQVLPHLGSDESLTVLVVRGRSRVETAEILEIDLTAEGDPSEWPDEGSVWSLVDIPGGVLAIESSGYGDPTLRALRELSAGGGAAAVVRSNIQAHLRFGCARDGELLFDDDEYMYAEDPSLVPAELRPLFDLVWDDLEGEDDIDDEGPSAFAVGLAMAELVTGIEVTVEQVDAVSEGPGFTGPGLVYGRGIDA
jgi:hypothetical protein